METWGVSLGWEHQKNCLAVGGNLYDALPELLYLRDLEKQIGEEEGG